MSVSIPPNAVLSSSGATWLNESGIIVAVGRNHAIHTLEHAEEVHRVNMGLAAGVRRPLLIDMTDVKSMSHEARMFYAGPTPAGALTAVAILTTSYIGKMVANAFISLTHPILPTRLFTHYEEALKWLLQFRLTDEAANGEGEKEEAPANSGASC